MSGLEIQIALQLGKALYGLKCKYDLQKANQHEVKELQDFIEGFEALLPDLRRSFRRCKGNPAGESALKQLGNEISNATRTIQRWSTSNTFFQMLTSPERLKEIQKVHQSLMMATQKHLSVASITMLLDIRADQANLTSDLKSLLINGMTDMSQAVAREVRAAASEASQGAYADEKFWADVLGALEASKCAPGDDDIPDRFLDPILADVMVDPILASNGITYCRWTIIDNNMTTDPHNPSEELTILGDNVGLRSELFERFPDLSQKFRQRRDEYRSEALSLAARGLLADAMLALQHVLRWNRKDAQASAALTRVQAAMKDAKSRQPSRKAPVASPKSVPPKVSPSEWALVPDSFTPRTAVVPQKTMKDSGVQSSARSVPPTKLVQYITAGAVAAVQEKPEASRSRSLVNHPPQQRTPQFLQPGPERGLARPYARPQGHQAPLGEGRRPSFEHGQLMQESENFGYEYPAQTRPSVRPQGHQAHFGEERRASFKHGQGLQESENIGYDYPSQTPGYRRPQQFAPPATERQGPTPSLEESKVSGSSKWKGTLAQVALAAVIPVSPSMVKGAYKGVAALCKHLKDGSKTKTATEPAHGGDNYPSDYYDENYGYPEEWDYDSHEHHGTNYEESYSHEHPYDYPYDQTPARAPQYAYSGCSSEEALRRHLAARKHS